MYTWDCGSQACVAGWAMRLSGIKRHVTLMDDEEVQQAYLAEAAALLKLSRDQAYRLFNPHYWPEDCQRGEAVYAAMRIDTFIESNGEI